MIKSNWVTRGHLQHVCVDPSTSVKPWLVEKSAETGSDVAPELRVLLIIHPGFYLFYLFCQPGWGGGCGKWSKLPFSTVLPHTHKSIWLRPDQKITKFSKIILIGWRKSRITHKCAKTFLQISTDKSWIRNIAKHFFLCINFVFSIFVFYRYH